MVGERVRWWACAGRRCCYSLLLSFLLLERKPTSSEWIGIEYSQHPLGFSMCVCIFFVFGLVLLFDFFWCFSQTDQHCVPVRPSVRLCSFVYVRCDPMVGWLVYSFKCHSLFFVFFITVVVVLHFFLSLLALLSFLSFSPFRVLPSLPLTCSTPLLSTLHSFLPSFLVLFSFNFWRPTLHFTFSHHKVQVTTGTTTTTAQRNNSLVPFLLFFNRHPSRAAHFFPYNHLFPRDFIFFARASDNASSVPVATPSLLFPSLPSSHPIPPHPSLVSFLCFHLLLFPFIDYRCSLDVLTLFFSSSLSLLPSTLFFRSSVPWDNSHFLHEKKMTVPKQWNVYMKDLPIDTHFFSFSFLLFPSLLRAPLL